MSILGSTQKVGVRVRVTSADGKHDLGFGTYVGDVLLTEALQEPIAPCVALPEPMELTPDEQAELERRIEELETTGTTTPKIILESGDVIYGFQCWWEECEKTDEPPVRLN